MKFEKLSENKIRIILNITDLVEKDIDFHVFMSNTIESQDILLDMLDEAKKQTGFDPENYNLKIEALSMADTSFIFTITKIAPESDTNRDSFKMPNKKVSVKKKSIIPSSQAVFSFNCFEDFCSYINFLNKCNLINETYKIANFITLYSYKQNYYLLFNDINQEIANRVRFYTTISEFAKYVSNSKVFSGKLLECGKLLIKNNALKIGFKYFSENKKK